MDDAALHGVVVGTVDYGEADRIVRFLCRERGRTALLARGARRSKRRFGASIEIGTYGIATARSGRGRLAQMVSMDPTEVPIRARRDLERLALLAYGCESVSALAPEDHPAPRLTELLRHWLGVLEGERTPGDAARVALEAKALTFAGLTPRLVHCARCGGHLTPPATFDPEAGGGLHANCGPGRSVDVATLRRIEHLRRTPMRSILEDEQELSERWLLSDFAQHHLGHGFRSRRLLEDLST